MGTGSTEFENKVVIITGSQQGIGLATDKLLASRGAKVAMADLVKKVAEMADAASF